MKRLMLGVLLLAWTAHARIKSSTGYPDAYKEEPFYKSDHFFGAAWKAMPADYSRDTLGWRVLDLLDDMANWGTPKYAIGEGDMAPNWTLPGSDGQTHRLEDLRGKYVVMAFFPKAYTGG